MVPLSPSPALKLNYNSVCTAGNKEEISGIDERFDRIGAADSGTIQPAQPASINHPNAPLHMLHNLYRKKTTGETQMQEIEEILNVERFIEEFNKNTHVMMLSVSLMLPCTQSQEIEPTNALADVETEPEPPNACEGEELRRFPVPARNEPPAKDTHEHLWDQCSGHGEFFHLMREHNAERPSDEMKVVAALDKRVGWDAVLVYVLKENTILSIDYGPTDDRERRVSALQEVCISPARLAVIIPFFFNCRPITDLRQIPSRYRAGPTRPRRGTGWRQSPPRDDGNDHDCIASTR